ncbi:MAG: hypothetical protein QXS31_06040 [Desulfurococcaceae archaeon]
MRWYRGRRYYSLYRDKKSHIEKACFIIFSISIALIIIGFALDIWTGIIFIFIPFIALIAAVASRISYRKREKAGVFFLSSGLGILSLPIYIIIFLGLKLNVYDILRSSALLVLP